MSDSITYNNLLFKYYLNLSYTEINSPTSIRKFLTQLALAITNFALKKLKKINHSSTFETVIFSSSLTLSTVHSILSPIFTFIILAIVDGRVVLTELFVTDPLLNFVFCLNNTVMTSILFLVIVIFICSTIYNLLDMITLKKVTFIYFKVLLLIRALKPGVAPPDINVEKKSYEMI